VNAQLKGVEKLEGTYIFDLKTSAKALRLNRFLHGFTVPEKRAAFKENQEAAVRKGGPQRRGAPHGARPRLGGADALRRELLLPGETRTTEEHLQPRDGRGVPGETLEAFLRRGACPGRAEARRDLSDSPDIRDLLVEIRDNQRLSLQRQEEHLAIAREQIERSRNQVEESIALQRQAVARVRRISMIASRESACACC